MIGPRLQAVYGVLWGVLGAIIGLSPPIGEGRRSQASPVVGWLIVAGAVVLLGQAIRQWRNGPQPMSEGRHRALADQVRSPKYLVAIVGVFGGSVWATLAGWSTHNTGLLALGLIFLSAVPAAVLTRRNARASRSD